MMRGNVRVTRPVSPAVSHRSHPGRCFVIAVLAVLTAGGAAPASAQTTFDDARLLPLTREFLIEGPAADPALNAVSDAVLASNGDVLVLDYGDVVIKRFGQRGALIGTIGRAGSGPGEFRGLSEAGWTGDTLWVHDATLRRITLFAGEKSVRSFPVQSPFAGTHSSLRPMAVRGSRIRVGVAVTPIQPDGTQQDFLLFHDDPLTGSTGTIRPLSRAGATLSLDVQHQGRLSHVQGSQPFSSAPLWGIARRGGVVVVDRQGATTPSPAQFTVSRYNEFGTPIFTRSLSYRPQRLDLATQASTLAWMRNSPITYNDAEVKRVVIIPPFLPPVQEAVIGSDGLTWLGLWEPVGNAERTTVVLDEKGVVLGRVRLPRNVRVFDSRGGRLLVGETPRGEVQRMAVYRVTLPSPR